MVLVVAPCKTDMVILTTRWWSLPVRWHSGGLNYKMVLVVAPCRTDIVTDRHYKMVVVMAPYRTDIVIDDTDMVLLSATNWW